MQAGAIRKLITWVNFKVRKPKQNGYYLLTVRAEKGRRRYVILGFFNDRTDWGDVPNRRVVAWAELPEPALSTE